MKENRESICASLNIICCITTTNMAHFTLDDAEIENLVSDIIKFNRAKQIAEWLTKIPDARPPSVFHPENDPTNKLMGYKDYNLGFYYAVAAGGRDIQSAVIQLRRQTRFCGGFENKRVFKSLEAIIFSAYRERGASSGMTVRKGWFSSHWGRFNGYSVGHIETKLDYEPSSPGQNERASGPLKDFIIFQFDRDLRNANPGVSPP